MTSYLPITISRISPNGEYDCGRQHIFRESTETYMTDMDDMQSYTSGQSLCGRYGNVTDGNWPIGWMQLVGDYAGDEIEPGCCKICKRIYDKAMAHKIAQAQLPEMNDDDDDETEDTNCPNCGMEYDEIDHEFQICHFCKFNNDGNQ